MFQKEIDKEAINKLEVRQFEGEIRIVDTNDSFKKALRELKKYSVLGFDTETKPTFKKGDQHKIALIQISNSKIAWLIRVNKIGLPPALVSLLEDDSVLKIGAGLHDDMRRLRQISKLNPGGFLDLQKYVEAFNIESKGLKKLVAIILGFKISKAQQMSNWEAEILSEQQRIYAATDAWVCLEIYNRLRSALELYNE